jgi:hypothetical protein
VVTLNRAARALKPTRVRFHAAAAGAAFALIAGLSAPAAAASVASTAAHNATATTSTTSTTSGAPAKVDLKDAMTKAVTQAAAPAAAPAPAKPWVPATTDLHTAPESGDQVSLSPTGEQIKNAKAIMDAGQAMHLPARAWVIAIATSLQESQLKNIGDLGANNDHDSLGLFQQRPSSGWGTPDQITNPTYSATSFYKGLIGVNNWFHLPLTDAAQAVQVSAFPDHYAKWENAAANLVNGFYGSGPYAAQVAATK